MVLLIITAYLSDDMGNPITGGNITFKMGNQSFTGLVSEGYVSITFLVPDNVGNLIVTGSYSGGEDDNIKILQGQLNIVG